MLAQMFESCLQDLSLSRVFILMSMDNGLWSEQSRSLTKVDGGNDRGEQSVLVYKTFRTISSFVGVWFAMTIAQGSSARRKPQGKTGDTWVVFEWKKTRRFRKRRFLCHDVRRAFVNFLCEKTAFLLLCRLSEILFPIKRERKIFLLKNKKSGYCLLTFCCIIPNRKIQKHSSTYKTLWFLKLFIIKTDITVLHMSKLYIDKCVSFGIISLQLELRPTIYLRPASRQKRIAANTFHDRLSRR